MRWKSWRQSGHRVPVCAITGQARKSSSDLPDSNAERNHPGLGPRPDHALPASSLYLTVNAGLDNSVAVSTAAAFDVFAAAFLADLPAFLPAAMALGAGFGTAVASKSSSVCPASMAALTQPGRGPRPDQEWPAPSAYFTAGAAARVDGALTLDAVAAFFAGLPPGASPRSCAVSPYNSIPLLMSATSSAASYFLAASAFFLSASISRVSAWYDDAIGMSRWSGAPSIPGVTTLADRSTRCRIPAPSASPLPCAS